jgi:prepilin-type N-terminal cleavage/methylation domain-containing protein
MTLLRRSAVASRTGSGRSRRGFSLLEVMVALAILTVSLVILAETQSSAVLLTNEAEKVITATDLAQLKLSEAMLRVESDGFQLSDVYEEGDFSDLGDDALDMEFGSALEDYHWEYGISEIDIDMLGDIATMSQDLDKALGNGEHDGPAVPQPAGNPAIEALSAFAFGPEQLTEMIGPFIREVRVRVWWGEDSEKAEEEGNEVVITTHAINPTGMLPPANGAAPPPAGGS